MALRWDKMTKEDKLDFARKNAGLSASQLAEKIEGCSRNAMIGFLHRNKIKFGSALSLKTGSRRNPPQGASGARKRILTPAPKPRESEDDLGEVINRIFHEPIVELEMPPESTQEPVIHKISIIDLNDSRCRFPVMESYRGLSPDQMFFCGISAAPHSVYCYEHAKRTTNATGRLYYTEGEQPSKKAKPSVRLWRR